MFLKCAYIHPIREPVKTNDPLKPTKIMKIHYGSLTQKYKKYLAFTEIEIGVLQNRIGEKQWC